MDPSELFPMILDARISLYAYSSTCPVKSCGLENGFGKNKIRLGAEYNTLPVDKHLLCSD